MNEMSRRALRLATAAGVALTCAAKPPDATGGLDCDAAWERDFKKPPLALKSLPLWHLNGTLTQAEIAAQLQASRDASGFAGVAVLPVKETQPEYLSEAYFERYGDILETCTRLGMKVVFYDDIGFPSGSAGGLMRKRFPDDTACRLDNTETNITGPAEWERALPLGTLMGAVAMNTQSKQRRDISASARDGRIAWTVPAGQWTLMLFTCVRAGGHVDYLCPESIDKFFSLTYDAYYTRFAPHFGTTIGMTFFDDVGVRGAERRTWTPAFNEKFEKKYGVSPVAFYPALWHDIGPDTEAARVALFGFRAELLAEGYPRKVHEWAAAHGLQSSGHAMGQYHPQPAFLGGDHILFYRHSDIPLIDSIHYYGHGRPGFKLTSSAAFTYDRPLTAVEIYGNYKTFDAAMLYRSGMELFARGANVLLPHGMWYDPQKVRIKPLISHFNLETGPELSRYNDWVGRSSLLLRGGRHVADIGVLYPVAAMQAFARLDAVVDQPKVRGNVHPGLYVPPLTDLNELSDCLTGELRRDFTFLHPEILSERCTIDGSLVRLNNVTNHEAYRVLILPSARVLHADNAKKLQSFVEAGGKVIVTGQVPAKSAELGRDAEVADAMRALIGERGTGVPPVAHGRDAPVKETGSASYVKNAHVSGGAAYFVSAASGAALGAALDDALPVPDVRFAQAGTTVGATAPTQSAPGNTVGVAAVRGMLSYLHKVKDGRNIYYLANSTDERVETFVTVRGKLTLQRWNPHDGSIAAAETSAVVENREPCTRVRLQLEPVRSVLFVETPAGE